MHVNVNKLSKIFGESIQWVVPVYQRHYSWGIEEEEGRVSIFWDDLAEQTSRILKEQQPFQHYFGAIIATQPRTLEIGGLAKRYIIDGQQRLTTFQLFMAAIREVSRDMDLGNFENQINRYLFIEEPHTATGEIDKHPKLLPTVNDRDVFCNIISNSLSSLRDIEKKHFYANGNLIKGKAPKPLLAYNFFCEKINEYIKERKQSDEVAEARSIEMLLYAFQNSFQIVGIQIEDDDDAHEIFESLNGKAEPLSSFDLIRNSVFHRARIKGEETQALFDHQWKYFEDDFWKTKIKQGRLKRDRADHMVGHAIIAETGAEVHLGKIGAEYEKYAKNHTPEFESVAEELQVLRNYAGVYKSLEDMPDGAPTNQIANVLKTWDLSVFHPTILWVQAQKFDVDVKIKIYKLIEDYIIRREICGLNPKNLNKVSIGIIREIRQQDNIIEAFISYMKNREGESTKMPSNDEILTACRKNNAYKSSNKLQYILCRLESDMRGKHDESIGTPKGLTLEHILPIKWAANWPLENGVKVDIETIKATDEADDNPEDKTRVLVRKREELVHTLGNLTVINRSRNASIGNSAWLDKKASLSKSLLAINRDVALSEVWDEKAILDRSKKFAVRINRLWPDIR